MVATTSLGMELDIQKMLITLVGAQYDTTRFPGLVYRLDKPKVVMLIFGSGKMVCTGAKKTEDVELAVEQVTKELRDAGLLK
jgi:transcription initiation factor TFIID TATA-box-binding protein